MRSNRITHVNPMAEESSKAKVFTIDPGKPFLKSLIPGILEKVSGRIEDLPEIRLFLPTRRACRDFQTEFLRYFEGTPVLLPKLQPLGDIDADELSLQLAGYDHDIAESELNIPPAISPLKRTLMLARMISQMPDYTRSAEQAIALAGELGKLIDRIHTENLDMGKLADLVPSDFAEHWQITLKFLNILSRTWPEILDEQGCIDAADRRNRLIKTLAKWYRHHRPDEIVIAAGSSGSIPATAELLDSIAHLPRGTVVLPGLDKIMSVQAWQETDHTHPQYALKKLLEKISLKREDIPHWPPSSAKSDTKSGTKSDTLESFPASSARQWLISTAMAPANALDEWAGLGLDGPGREELDKALENVHLVTAQSPEQEARVIALAFREMLEREDKDSTAVLVTPDRNLARRVSATCLRWGMQVDDSGGLPLSRSKVGSFLSLTARAFIDHWRPVSFLSMLKHTLSGPLPDSVKYRFLVREMDKNILRGPAPRQPGPGGLYLHIEEICAGQQQSPGNPDYCDELKELVACIENCGKKFLELVDGNTHSFAAYLNAHIDLCENLAGGPDRLWIHEDGEAAALLLAELNDSRNLIDPLSPRDYLAILSRFMENKAVRPLFGTHPRLRILGQLESRLIDADLVIMAGLNEGTWPPEAEKDPWMSRPMRSSFKMSSPDESIGKAAHDFTQLFNHPQVLLTRSSRVDGMPSVPARWLQRLDAVMEALERKEPDKRFRLNPGPYLYWAEHIDDPKGPYKPVMRPAPNPPLEARPRKLSVTAIEKWMCDPYHVYASKILGLRKLDPPEKDAEAAERGEWIHDVMKEFTRQYPKELPEDPHAQLARIGLELLGPRRQDPSIMGFWWPRFEEIIDWVISHELDWRKIAHPVITEETGSVVLRNTTTANTAQDFTLTARVDRIDVLAAGGAVIIDYKTGSLPSKIRVLNGLSPQLPLEGLIVNDNGFEKLRDHESTILAYWYMPGTYKGNRITDFKTGGKGANALDMTELIERCRLGITSLIAAFDKCDSQGTPLTPYYSIPRPEFAPPEEHQDFAHLARVKEWRVLGDAGNGESS